jgi:hypothetical protein
MIKINRFGAIMSATIFSSSLLAAAGPSTTDQSKPQIIEAVFVTAKKKPKACRMFRYPDTVLNTT